MTEYGGHDEQYHRDEQQRTPAVFITQWSEKDLSQCQSYHTGGKSQLHHRRVSRKNSLPWLAD